MILTLHPESNTYLSAYIHATNHVVSLHDKEFHNTQSMFNYDLGRMKNAMASGFDLIPDYDSTDDIIHWLETSQ